MRVSVLLFAGSLAAAQAWAQDTVSLKSLASSYAASGDPRARETYERAIAATPRDLPLRVEFAEFLWRSGEMDAGNARMEEVIRLAPDNLRLRAHYGVNLAGQKKYGKAVEELDAARRAGFDDPNVLLYLGSALWEIGRLDEAKERLREAVAKAPDRAAARHRLGRLLLLQGNPVAAAAELLRAAELDPASPEIAMDVGRALEASGDSPGAERAYRQALAHDPEPPLAHYLLGTLLARTGRREEAGRHLALYKESFERDQQQQFRSRSRQAELNLGRARLSERRYEEALAQFNRLPDDPEALRGAAQALSGLGRYGEAAARLSKALELDPGNPTLRSELDAARQRAKK